jgi:hypothetical protein
VDRADTDLAEWKIKELQKLAEIFDQFDRKYRDRLYSVILKIKEKIRVIVDKALQRIKVCMKSGNELYDEDIKKMQEAHLFQRKIESLIQTIENPEVKQGAEGKI